MGECTSEGNGHLFDCSESSRNGCGILPQGLRFFFFFIAFHRGMFALNVCIITANFSPLKKGNFAENLLVARLQYYREAFEACLSVCMSVCLSLI